MKKCLIIICLLLCLCLTGCKTSTKINTTKGHWVDNRGNIYRFFMDNTGYHYKTYVEGGAGYVNTFEWKVIDDNEIIVRYADNDLASHFLRIFDKDTFQVTDRPLPYTTDEDSEELNTYKHIKE